MQHRPARPGRVDREGARVDHARAVHRIDAEPPPGEIDERDPRDQLHVDPGRAHQLDTALGDGRAAGNGVDDLAALACGLDHPIGDRGVHGVEIVGAVVEQIERLELDALTRRGRRPRDGARCARTGPAPVRARRAPREAAGRRRPDRARPQRRAASRRHYGVPVAHPESPPGTSSWWSFLRARCSVRVASAGSLRRPFWP